MYKSIIISNQPSSYPWIRSHRQGTYSCWFQAWLVANAGLEALEIGVVSFSPNICDYFNEYLLPPQMVNAGCGVSFPPTPTLVTIKWILAPKLRSIQPGSYTPYSVLLYLATYHVVYWTAVPQGFPGRARSVRDTTYSP